MRNITIFLAAILLGGCMLKTDVKPALMYEIYYSKNVCEQKTSPKNIYLQSVKALDIVDNRQILIISDKNQIRYLDDIKYLALPSEMFYKALLKGVYSNCGAKPVFSPKDDDLSLKVRLISLQIRGDHAEVSLAYELKNGENIVKSGLINKRKFCENPKSVTIFNTINQTANLAIDELLAEIFATQGRE
ncbi:ABC-type transport auxiliary lipoprotein family protein [Campylobacter gastrosuis]|uniref:ABC-type transport auxiliary lipoprotein family protein n=1 Tax=Campylobacter gastrosuis TaxID=2974576 RepID=A0ABT7HPC0_9BACT|nr:ABC-type transport auxiliary lipoprotein family protein [Campylobacter gastrosuis]MDL0088660.1 ABC-type transport auxiliary lipoprotein family protein [Campylobacter gastrosuis]